MTPIFKSIRWRVQAWHGLILIAVLAGFGLTAYQVAWDSQVQRIDRELEQQLAAVSRPPPPEQMGPRDSFIGPGRPRVFPLEPGELHGPLFDHRRRERPDLVRGAAFFRARLRDAIVQTVGAASGQTNSFYFILWQEDGSVAARSASAPENVPHPKWIRSAEPEPGAMPRLDSPPGSWSRVLTKARTRGEFRESYRFLPFGDCLLAGRSMAPDRAGMRRLALLLGLAGSGILVLGLAGGWWVSTRAIRPIEEISATAVKIAAGDLSQRINAADTESELGRLADVLNSTFARLEAAFTAQARFTSDASHELRTPVSVILSQTQLALARERSAAEYRQALEVCQRAAQRMRKLSASLLELARLDSGQEPFQHEQIDLAQLSRECVELIGPLTDRGIQIRCELLGAECIGDAERMAQVVTNLLTNAIYYNREGGEVLVSTHLESDAAVLTVSDTGRGILPEDLPHIFERFYRADKSRSGSSGRTGLGLAISKAIIEGHNGTIQASSQPGEGASFTVRLPRIPGHGSSAGLMSKATPMAEGAHRPS